MNKNKCSKGRNHICLVVPGAYPLLAGKNPKNIIGPDVRVFLLAKELMKHDFKITLITFNKEEVIPVDYIDGIRTINIHDNAYHLRVLYIIVKVFRMWNAMHKAKAHICFHSGGITGPVSLFCRVMKKKFIYGIASDALVNRGLITRKIKGFNRSKFSLGIFSNWLDIKLADAIIVQSEYQKTMLKNNFGKNGIVIKNPFPLTEREMPEKANPPIVLWVGSMAEVKQPELFVKLAEAIPEARFQMIGGHSGNQELYDWMKDTARSLSNLEFLGVVPLNEIDEYFGRASILVNTSMFEGFPNAFIQAWMHYVPVVSLNADPDELLCENGLGVCSNRFEQMVEDVKILLKDEQLRQKMGKNSRQYVEREHDISNIIKEYIGLFDRIGEV